jgi:aminopeptidase N
METDPGVLSRPAGQIRLALLTPYVFRMLPLLLLLQQTPSPLAARADTIHPVHDAIHYDITLVPSDTGTHVLAEVQTTWRLRSTEPVEMELDSAMRVVRVLIDGKENTRLSRTLYARSSGEVEVPHEKHAGDTVVTRVRYHGYVRDGLIIGRNQYGERTIFADNWPDRAHLWLASQDHPSDKATVALHVQAPIEDQVIANGVLEKIDTLAYGHVVWNYRMDRPIPVYTMVVGIGRLARTQLPTRVGRSQGMPLSVWTYPRDSSYAVNGPFRRAREIVDYFSDLIGPFPYASLTHVESSTRYGGMENSTAIFYDEKRYQQANMDEAVVAHETAHQWFGDAVTEADWHHVWLSEGFATYLAALWRLHADGDSAFRAEMARAAAEVFQSQKTERPVLDTAATDLPGLLNSNSYQKGSWVLHQLRGLVGDSAFFAGLRSYYARHRDGTAVSEDFARVMSQAAGQDLEWYFRQSLLQPGYPMLQIGWTHSGKKLTLDVRQTQPDGWGAYRLRHLILLVDGRPVRVDIEGRQNRIVVDGIKKKPKTIAVDPGGWWLLKSVVRGER